MNEVFNMDCMEGMKQYPDNYFELAVVDPPYGMKKKGSGYNTVDSNGIEKVNAVAPPKEYFEELYRVSKEWTIWGANYLGISAKCTLVWDKQRCVDNWPDAEIAICSMDKPVRIFKHRWDGFMKASEYGIKRIHPTQKPIALYEWIYKNYLPDGGKVIDTHLGSGSNRIAAEKTGNIDFTGYEIDKDYFDASVKRYNQFKSQLCLSL
jgi:site-specific DNA-methyltransferase (adenine-specific)